MSFILELLFEALILILLARFMAGVHVRSYGLAVAVALVIGILNATIGALLRFPLNLVTLFLLSFIVRLIVTAMMIQLTAALFRGFTVDSFKTALIISVVLALAGSFLSFIL